MAITRPFIFYKRVDCVRLTQLCTIEDEKFSTYALMTSIFISKIITEVPPF